MTANQFISGKENITPLPLRRISNLFADKIHAIAVYRCIFILSAVNPFEMALFDNFLTLFIFIKYLQRFFIMGILFFQ